MSNQIPTEEVENTPSTWREKVQKFKDNANLIALSTLIVTILALFISTIVQIYSIHKDIQSRQEDIQSRQEDIQSRQEDIQSRIAQHKLKIGEDFSQIATMTKERIRCKQNEYYTQRFKEAIGLDPKNLEHLLHDDHEKLLQKLQLLHYLGLGCERLLDTEEYAKTLQINYKIYSKFILNELNYKSFSNYLKLVEEINKNNEVEKLEAINKEIMGLLDKLAEENMSFIPSR